MTPDCPACGSGRTRRSFRAMGATFLRCRSCSTLFDAAPLPEEQRAAIYEGRSYFVKEANDDAANGYAQDYLADRAFIAAKFDQVLGHVERYVQPGRLLDVGAGPGFLLDRAVGRGWEAIGVDLNPWAVAYGRDELGVDLRQGQLVEGMFPDASFDAVTLMDVVEHVPDPSALLALVARLVRPGGTVALLTPDAAAPMSRLLGRRWPEVRMPGEHPVLFSRRGLSSTLARHGLVSSGWHPVGKTATVATLIADVSAAAPILGAAARRAVSGRPVGQRVLELDPHTKVCLYARRLPVAGAAPAHLPGRVPKRVTELADVDAAILEELEQLAAAPRYGAWLYDTFSEHVRDARVLEVGAGIGTFTQRMLDAGARELLLIEPEDRCADVLDERFADDPRVEVSRDHLPAAPSLESAAGTFDLVVCQNVLEHIGDDAGAVRAMAAVLRPGGHLALVVPAGPGLFGALDDAYGHWRRYDRAALRSLVDAAGLEVGSLRAVNAPGIAAWWLKNRRPGARVGGSSLRAYEVVVALWRPIEDRLQPRFGLTLACIARRSATATAGDVPVTGLD